MVWAAHKAWDTPLLGCEKTSATASMSGPLRPQTHITSNIPALSKPRRIFHGQHKAHRDQRTHSADLHQPCGFRILVPSDLWISLSYHAATGDRKIADTKAIQRLADAGFRIVLHGNVQEERDEALHYLDPQRGFTWSDGGGFGAPANDKPESTPRLNSLLEVSRDLQKVTVHRRINERQRGWAIYPREGGGKTVSYEISCNSQR